jgi:predicted signal transduction protein with EAL and GGDEF domain
VVVVVVVPDLLTIGVPALLKTAVARHLRSWWWRSRRADERHGGPKPTGVV